MYSFQPFIGNKSQLDGATVENGKFIVIADRQEIYVDYNGSRIRIASNLFDNIAIDSSGPPGLLWTQNGAISALQLGNEGGNLTIKNGVPSWSSQNIAVSVIQQKFLACPENTIPTVITLPPEEYILDFSVADCASALNLAFDCEEAGNPQSWEIWVHASENITSINLAENIAGINLPSTFNCLDNLPTTHMLLVRHIPNLNIFQLSYSGSFSDGGCFLFAADNSLLQKGITLENITVESSSTLHVYRGGTAIMPTISDGAALIIHSGGSAINVIAEAGSDIQVESGGAISYYTPPEIVQTPDDLTGNNSNADWEFSASFAEDDNADPAKAYLAANGDHTNAGTFRLTGFANGDATCSFIWKRNSGAWQVNNIVYGLFRLSVFPQSIRNFQLQGSNDGVVWSNIGSLQTVATFSNNQYTEQTFDYPDNTAKYVYHRLLCHNGETYGDISYSSLAAGATLIKMEGIA